MCSNHIDTNTIMKSFKSSLNVASPNQSLVFTYAFITSGWAWMCEARGCFHIHQLKVSHKRHSLKCHGRVSRMIWLAPPALFTNEIIATAITRRISIARLLHAVHFYGIWGRFRPNTLHSIESKQTPCVPVQKCRKIANIHTHTQALTTKVENQGKRGQTR